MRIQPWMTVLASVAMLFAAQSTSWGQGYPPQGGPYQPPYGTNNPGVMYPQGTPANMQPWPGISPYQSANIAETVHYNHKGSWFKEILYKEREYFASLEAISIRYRGPGNAVIGSPFARLNGLGDIAGVSSIVPFAATTSTGLGDGTFQFDPRVFPFPALDAGNNTYVEVTLDAFPIHNAQIMGAADSEAGILGRWGFEDEDGAGMMITGWIGGKADTDFQRGARSYNGVTLNQNNILVFPEVLNTRYGNVPLDTGEGFFPFVGTGSTAKFDVMYRIAQTSQAGGVNISSYTRPIYKSDAIKLRPLYGLRYTHIKETFAFNGIDSGFTYDYDDAGGDATFIPDSGLINLYPLYEATLNNEVQSHIAGPEIGLRFDLGSGKKGLSIWGETIVGLAANFEEISLNGDDIGDPLIDARFNRPTLVPRLLDPTIDSTFSEKNSGTHLSPTFQQSIFADMHLFKYVPGLKKMDLFEEAKLRFGYTVNYIGEVGTPTDSIKWQGFPLFPEIQNNRKLWYTQQFNLGIDWTF